MPYTPTGPFTNNTPTPPINAQALNNIEQGILTGATTYNILTYGAKNDSTTDNTTPIQNAINDATQNGGGTITIPQNPQNPNGIYLINNTITITPGITITGDGMGVTKLSHPGTTPLFQSLNPNTTTQTPIWKTTGVNHMTIYAKNPIQINDTDSFTNGKHNQNYIMGPQFRALELINPGNPASTATGAGTTTQPTPTELRNQGVAINLTQCYNTIIQNCDIEGYGIAIYFDDCDISTIRNNRLAFNSRHLHNTHHDGGGRVTIERNDILSGYRNGHIYTDAQSTTIRDNYFEPAPPAIPNVTPQILYTATGDYGLSFTDNSIDLNANTSPMISIACGIQTIIDRNRINTDTNGATHTNELRYEYASWNPTNTLNPIHWGTNPGMNKPGNIKQGTTNPYAIGQGNIAPGSTGGALGSWPFTISPNHGRYVIRTDNQPLTAHFQLTTTTYRNFKIFYTGRKTGTNTGYRAVTYTENGTTTTLITGGNLGFTATTGVQTITETVSIPTTAQGTGYIEINVANNEIEYERIELIPTYA